jgi:hypothetical protein
MERGIHGLPKVSSGPALPNPSAQSFTPLDTARRTGLDDAHGRMARVIHGFPKVSLGLAMLYGSTPCGRPPLNRDGLQGGRPAVVLLPPWIRHAIHP